MHEQTVLLNHLLTQSITQAPEDTTPPTHGIEELFSYIKSRSKSGVAIEFFGDFPDDLESDKDRIEYGKSKKYDFIRIKDANIEEVNGRRYIVMLIHHIDQKNRSFPVVNLDTYEGREITAEENERGVTSAHVVISLPSEGDVDDAKYRCAIEYTSGITRRGIEFLLNRQLRRSIDWEFSVEQTGKRGPIKSKIYKYRPKIRLASDIYRNLLVGDQLALFSSAVFTKRSTRDNTAKEIELMQEDIVADIEVRISGSQAPADPAAKKAWLNKLISWYQDRGYRSKLYYRHMNGRKYKGTQSTEIDGAADRLLCNTTMYSLTTERSKWDNIIQGQAVQEIVNILRRDELWQKAKAD